MTTKAFSEVYKVLVGKDPTAPQAGAAPAPHRSQAGPGSRPARSSAHTTHRAPGSVPQPPGLYPPLSEHGVLCHVHIQEGHSQHRLASPADTGQQQLHVLGTGTFRRPRDDHSPAEVSAQVLSSSPCNPRLQHEHTTAERTPCLLAQQDMSPPRLAQVLLQSLLMFDEVPRRCLTDVTLTSLQAVRISAQRRQGKKQQVRFPFKSSLLKSIAPFTLSSRFTRASTGTRGYQHPCTQTQLWSFLPPSPSFGRAGEWQTLTFPAVSQDIRDGQNRKLSRDTRRQPHKSPPQGCPPHPEPKEELLIHGRLGWR